MLEKDFKEFKLLVDSAIEQYKYSESVINSATIRIFLFRLTNQILCKVKQK